MKNTVKLYSLIIVSIALAVLSLQAADTPTKAAEAATKEPGASASSNRSIPFRGKLEAKTDTSIKVGTRTFVVNSETKLVKAGKPATLADAVLGEEVGGSYQEKDGALIAKSVRFGAKPDEVEGEAAPKK